jgi:urease accessory protein
MATTTGTITSTATVTITTMSADTALLQLLWLASPALPIGGFSYSEGLEAAVDAGLVTSEQQAGDWLVDQLHLTLARCDLSVVAAALGAWRAGNSARIGELNAWVLRTRETAELRQQTEQMGRSLVEWLRNQDAADDRLAHAASLVPSPTWPVVFGLATARSGATAAQALQCCLFGWAENLVQAAMKAVPLGQLAGQRILQALLARMPARVDEALALDDDRWQSFSPMLGIESARHETQYSRLFRS